MANWISELHWGWQLYIAGMWCMFVFFLKRQMDKDRNTKTHKHTAVVRWLAFTVAITVLCIVWVPAMFFHILGKILRYRRKKKQ
jgi:hypothetical protein